jgi:hypothetical protein
MPDPKGGEKNHNEQYGMPDPRVENRYEMSDSIVEKS